MATPPDTIVTVALASAAALLVTVLAYQQALDRRRRAAYERFSLERGFRFEHARPGEEQRHAATWPLFAQGHGRRWGVTISGAWSGIPFTAFEYQWTTGHGKGAHTHRIAAVLWGLEREGKLLPQFMLTPEGVRAKLAALLGGQDIDFQDSPEFSRGYRLQGSDETAVRALFTPHLRHTFAMDAGRHVAGAGPEVMWWRHGRLPPPEAFDQLLMEGDHIRALFDRR